jgi:hypothetical protein
VAYEIRSMSIGEMLDTGFRLVRNHFVVLVGISAALYVPLALAVLPFSDPAEIASSPGTLGIAFFVATFVGLLVAPIVMAGITYALGELYLGRRVTIVKALGAGLSMLMPLMGTWLLASLLLLAAFAIFLPILFAAVAKLMPVGAAIPLGLLAAVVPIYVALRFLLLTQVMVLEHVFGTEALRRSADVIRDHALRGFAVLFVGGLVTNLLLSGVNFALGWIPVAGAVATALAESAGFSFTSAIAVLLYFDIRCRKEAFDLEHLSRLVEGRVEPA